MGIFCDVSLSRKICLEVFQNSLELWFSLFNWFKLELIEVSCFDLRIRLVIVLLRNILTWLQMCTRTLYVFLNLLYIRRRLRIKDFM